MDLTKYYPDIAAKYPAYVTQRELCEICRICPKTAYNLEQQGEIPYTIEQNHLIRSHKIKLTDILAYLYRRECRQEADSPYICAMRTFYDKHLSPYCSGVYLSPDQVIQLLKDMEQDPKVLEDLEGLWSNGQIAVLKKALSAAAKSGVGLLEATEVVEPNPISPNESTSYSNLYHCDRDGVYLYIDAVSGQLADAIGKNEG